MDFASMTHLLNLFYSATTLFVNRFLTISFLNQFNKSVRIVIMFRVEEFFIVCYANFLCDVEDVLNCTGVWLINVYCAKEW